MDEVTEYRRAVSGDLADLYAEDPPARRLRGIYRTSRHNISSANAARLWDCLIPLRRVVDHQDALSRQEHFDELVLSCALAVESQLGHMGAFGGFGIGQKLVNLYMKDQWALGRVTGHEGFLHAPLDRIVLTQIPGRRRIAPMWGAWTKVNAGQRDCEAVCQYIALQHHLADAAAAKAISRIQFEQAIWGTRRARHR